MTTLRTKFAFTGLAALLLACAASAEPVPYASLGDRPTPPSELGAAPVSGSEASKLRDAVEAAKSGDTDRARAVQSSLADPVARRVVEWAMVDSAASRLSFFELDSARRDLWGWPRPARRQAGAEKAMDAASLSPQRVVDWFDGKDPTTAEGAMTLASAYQSLGRQSDAEALIRHFWRDKVFEADIQSRMVSRWGQILTADDNARRLGVLLYGAQGPAARAMLDLVGPDEKALAQARIALREDRNDAPSYVARTSEALQSDPGLAFERARYYRKRNLDTVAVQYLRGFPTNLPPEVAEQIWAERRSLMTSALRSGDTAGAYAAVSAHGLAPGANYAEAEFFAGWLALDKLHNPTLAETHFARLQAAGSSPITLSRALYWRGKAAEALGDSAGANAFWSQGGQYYTTFYGQLSAEKAGQHTIALGPDPSPTSADRERFETRDQIRAARLLADAGERDTFRTFVLGMDDVLPSPEEQVLLVDMSRQYGDQDLSMRVVRAGAQRGFYMPERGYPVRPAPTGGGLPEPAFTLAIIRQESSFDPTVRSGPGARGMMQLMPGTASVVARRMGVAYSASRLDDPDYNMRLGAAYLGQLTDEMGGSYVLAAASYNAGPGRARQWMDACGDPKSAGTDPADFIECIGIPETRNYVMRILETVQVYRARLNGGSAPLQLTADLKRGAWVPGTTSPGSYAPTAGQPYTPSPSPYVPAATPAASRR